MRLFIIKFLFLLVINTHAQYQGTIYHDLNNNGKNDINELPIPNVLVSDGLHVVQSNAEGRFNLPGRNNDQRFIFVITPAGYHIDSFYHYATTPDQPYHFGLRKVPEKTGPTTFIQITDTETDKNNTQWIEMLQAYIEHEKVDFLIHTGDICYVKGMNFHSKALTTQTMGVPTYYCIGNHDLVDGPYGEALFEELFGPGWYAFERGGSMYIVTPMLRGDYKPSYTQKDIYQWLKNLLEHLDSEQPKFVFNHDLLTGDAEFIYGINDEEYINLNEHHLKAWVYGHWHNSFYRPHQPGGPVSICTGVAQRGGIDHSLAQFRVFTVEENGNFQTEIVQSYVDHALRIIYPSPVATFRAHEVPILVNAYNSTSSIKQLQYQLNREPWKNLDQVTNWTWEGKITYTDVPPPTDTFELKVAGYFNDGEIREQKRSFTITPTQKANRDGYWPNLLLNGAHHPGNVSGPSSPLQLDWVTNVGANIFMCPPIIAEGKVFIATYDNGDARNGFVVAYDIQSGAEVWRYRTQNSIKGAIAYEDGQVFGTDMVGNVYAINSEHGTLNWTLNLELKALPAYVSSTIAENGVLYTGEGKSFCALQQKDGAKVWCNDQWNSGVGGPAAPTIGKDFIVASSNWNAMYCHDLQTGKLLWKEKDYGLRFRDAAPTFVDDTLFVGTQQSLLAINPKNGKILRQKELEVNLKTNSTPLVTNHLLVMGTSDQGLMAFDRYTFEPTWQFAPKAALTTTTPYSEPPQLTIESSPVLVNGEEIYFGASDGNFYSIDIQTGKVNWHMEVGAPILATIAVTENRIFLVDLGGNLYAFR